MRWRDLLYPKSGSRRAGLNHTGLSDFKFSALPRKAESPEGVQKGTHKVCGGQGGSPVHGHSGCLMYGGGGTGISPQRLSRAAWAWESENF